MSWGTINSIALVANLAGVVLLFFFGMPFRLGVSGAIAVSFSRWTEKDERDTRRYKLFGYLGLALIVLGTFVQVWVSIATL